MSKRSYPSLVRAAVLFCDMTRPRPGEGLADADGRVIADTAELHRAFLEAIEAGLESEILVHIPGSASKLAGRAARGEADALSEAIRAVAAQLWRQTGRRGFRGSIARFTTAAVLVIGWVTGMWLPTDQVWWVETGPGRRVPAPKVRDLIGDRMTTGPPTAMPGDRSRCRVLAVSGRSGP